MLSQILSPAVLAQFVHLGYTPDRFDSAQVLPYSYVGNIDTQITAGTSGQVRVRIDNGWLFIAQRLAFNPHLFATLTNQRKYAPLAAYQDGSGIIGSSEAVSINSTTLQVTDSFGPWFQNPIRGLFFSAGTTFGVPLDPSRVVQQGSELICDVALAAETAASIGAQIVFDGYRLKV